MSLFTNEFISQGIVLASILAGFGFSITAQVALASNSKNEVLRSALYFMAAGISSISGVVLGMISLLNIGSLLSELLSSVMASVLLIALLFFIGGLKMLIKATLGLGSIVYKFIGATVAIPLAIGIVFLILRAVI